MLLSPARFQSRFCVRESWPALARAAARATAALRYETKSPRPAPGALRYTAVATCLSSSNSSSGSIPADTDAGSTTRGAVAGVTGGDNLDPEFTLVLEVRGFTGLAQCIEAVLLRTRGCGGESRQIEDHPRAFLPFRQGEGHGRPFGGHLDFGTGSYGAIRCGEVLAVAAENDWRLSRSCTRASGSASAASATRTARTARTARSPGSTATSGCHWTAGPSS